MKKEYKMNSERRHAVVTASVPLLRAHLLLKQHGQEVCRRTRPLCEQCPIFSDCAYFRAMRNEFFKGWAEQDSDLDSLRNNPRFQAPLKTI